MTREEKIAYIKAKRDEFRNAWVLHKKPQADEITQRIIEEFREMGISDEALLICDDLLELLIEKGYLKI
jgi:hypothetical protein